MDFWEENIEAKYHFQHISSVYTVSMIYDANTALVT